MVRRAFRIVAMLGGLMGAFLAGAGCESASSQCLSDVDCASGQRCVAGGGALVRGGVCVGEVGGEEDVGGLDDVEQLPTDSGVDRDSGGSDERDPCDGVGCSGEGICAVASGAAVCVCDEGFRAQGLSCVPIEDPCGGVACSGAGTCVVAAGQAACLCDEGYRPEGLTCVEASASNPCEGVTCAGHGTCVQEASGPVCECQPYYRAVGLSCIETCNGSVDEEGLCDIWVLRRGSEQWRGYRLDPAQSGNTPGSTLRAAFDVEDEDVAFVLTGSAYHRFTPSTLRWGEARPLTDIAPGLTTVDRIAAAYSVPSTYGGDGTREGVTISAIHNGEKLVWQVDYVRATQTFVRTNSGLYGDAHQWSDTHAPSAAQMRANWVDSTNERGWAQGNPSQYCETPQTAIVGYAAVLTSTHVHYLDGGSCFVFMPAVSVASATYLQYPGAPSPSVVGAAFWHKGALYMFRGE
jgi:hypothetical protein